MTIAAEALSAALLEEHVKWLAIWYESRYRIKDRAKSGHKMYYLGSLMTSQITASFLFSFSQTAHRGATLVECKRKWWSSSSHCMQKNISKRSGRALKFCLSLTQRTECGLLSITALKQFSLPNQTEGCVCSTTTWLICHLCGSVCMCVQSFVKL